MCPCGHLSFLKCHCNPRAQRELSRLYTSCVSFLKSVLSLVRGLFPLLHSFGLHIVHIPILWLCPASVCPERRPRFYAHRISPLEGWDMSVWSSFVSCKVWSVTVTGTLLKRFSRLLTSGYLLYRNTDAKGLSLLAQTLELEPIWLRICCCRLYTWMTTWTRSPGPSAPFGPCSVLIGWLHLWRRRWRECCVNKTYFYCKHAV